jgi:hypothetical protein
LMFFHFHLKYITICAVIDMPNTSIEGHITLIFENIPVMFTVWVWIGILWIIIDIEIFATQ